MCASAWFYYIARLPAYVQWNGILWHASQIYMYMICSGIKVGLLYNNAGYICDVKCIESDSHSANYTSFMLNTINATIFKLILPYDY